MVRLFPRVIFVLAAFGAAGCLNAQAKTKLPPVTPPLNVPAPPSRVMVPVTVPTPEPTPEPTATPTPPPVKPTNPTAGNRPPDRSTPTPTPSPTPEATPAVPTPVIQTSSNTTELEKTTRAMMAAAQADLDRVDRSILTSGGIQNFKTAQSYLKRASDALDVKNVDYAHELADKAVKLAALFKK